MRAESSFKQLTDGRSSDCAREWLDPSKKASFAPLRSLWNGVFQMLDAFAMEGT